MKLRGSMFGCCGRGGVCVACDAKSPGFGAGAFVEWLRDDAGTGFEPVTFRL